MLTVLLLSIVHVGLAQRVFEKPITYTTREGLPHDKVTCLAEDADGFMWVGTENGLSRTDGSVFENFYQVDGDEQSIKNDHILDVLPDLENGKVWIATVVGLSVYNIRNKTFKNYYHDENNPNTIPDHRAYCIYKDKFGVIWVGFRAGGILRYRPETDDFERFLCFNESTQSHERYCDNAVLDIEEDKFDDNVLWLATHFGVIEFHKNSGDFTVHIYKFEDDVFQNYINSHLGIMPHANGKIYLSTYYSGVTVFDTKTKEYSRLDPCYKEGNASLGKDIIHSFNLKSPNEVWINSREGLQLYNIISGCIEQTFVNDRKHWYSVDFIDSKGRYWSKTRERGFQIFNPLLLQSKKIIYEDEDSDFSSYTNKILEDVDNKLLYILADRSRGLFIYNQSTGSWKIIPPPVNYNMEDDNGFRGMDMIFLPDQSILIIEDTNLYHYRPGEQIMTLFHKQAPIKAPRWRNVIRDSQGYYWLSSYILGLHRYDFSNQESISFERRFDELGHRLGGNFLAEDAEGHIWLREHNGLIIYQPENDSLIYLEHDTEKNNSHRGMGAIETDANGGIWIAGRDNSMGFAQAEQWDKGVLRFFDAKDGLKGEHIYLAKPYQDKVLIFSDVGMQIFDPATLAVEKYFSADYGIGKNISNATQLADGSLAVGGKKSIQIFSPNQLLFNEEIPLPYVSAFSVFDKSWNLNSSPNRIDTVQLSYKQNFFSFEFSSIAFNLPEQTNFRYKLEGFDEHWQDGTKRRFAAYTNVPGGEYNFIVEAVNNEGLSLATPSSTLLYISTVWYKTIWFWVLTAILLFAIAYAIYKWRIDQVRKEERLRSDYERKLADVEMSALRAQMNPHFIFNSLNSIEYYIINNDPEKASDYLNRFSRLIRLILQNSKNTIVTLKDDLEALKLYIEMESMRFDDLFDYEVKIEKGIDLDKIYVPPMLLQPYVENAIWHGLMQKEEGRGKLELKLERSNGHLQCFVEDNGIGREAASKLKSKSATRRKSYGMKITSDRLAMLNNLAGSNASVQIVDLKNAEGSGVGTRVELVIPL